MEEINQREKFYRMEEVNRSKEIAQREEIVNQRRNNN
jgi:hypothetical protein